MFKVEKDRCIGCGACVGTCNDIFDFDDIQNAMDKSIEDKANIVKAVIKI